MAKKNTVMNPIKAARISAGLTQKKMAEMLKIPISTVECWVMGNNKPPIWAELLIIEKLEQIAKEREEQV